jgi:ribosomal protein S18 acetylase RimI-like enzyme
MKAAFSELYTRAFGYQIGSLEVDPPIYPYDVIQANKDEFACVFVRVRGWWDPTPVGELASLSYLYDMELDLGPWVVPTVHAPTEIQKASADHLEIARTAFKDSRFLLDWRLNDLASETYARWIAGRDVHVLKNSPDAAFLYVTDEYVSDEKEASRISLTAVREKDRGLGVGGMLIRSVITKICGLWQVKVYCKNYRAVRFYESIGFKVKSVETVFHVWTDRKKL